MRKTIVCIGILFFSLLITPCEVLAGTDDSGLQVFTLNGADMMGESADVAQEDTKIAQYSLNMFQSGNGLTCYGRQLGSGYEWDGDANAITGTQPIVRTSSATDPARIYVHTNGSYGAPTGTRSILLSAVSTSTDLLTFKGLSKEYIFNGDYYMSSTDGWATTASVSLPANGTRCALWQNRFWYVGAASPYTIYYSAAQDYEDFTNSATKGGTTNIFGIGSIKKLVGTRYGLYIFTDGGIFLQSGPSKAWSIEKISDLILYGPTTICTYNDNIFFQSQSPEGRKVFILSGTSIATLTTIPPTAITTGTMAILNAGKILILAQTSNASTAWIYDLDFKSWTRSTEYQVFGSNLYFLKMPSYLKYSIYTLPKAEKFNAEVDAALTAYTAVLSYVVPLAWSYSTNWFTLDGNASNRKEIDRIEFDYQGGTQSVLLYWASGNGSSASWGTYLIAPTNSRFNTQTWNKPMGGGNQSNRFYLAFASVGAQTMTRNYVLKQIRVYYRNIGNYKTNALR